MPVAPCKQPKQIIESVKILINVTMLSICVCCCSISTNLVEYLTSPDILNFDLVTGNNTVSNFPQIPTIAVQI